MRLKGKAAIVTGGGTGNGRVIAETFARAGARIYSTNPQERLNKEIKRRTNVVGVFPDGASAVRLAGSVLVEIADDWRIGRGYFSLESMARVMAPQPLLVAEPAAFHLAPVH